MSHVDLEKKRNNRLRQYAIAQAQERFDRDYPGFQPEEILVSLCAYEEEANIGAVLEKMPADIDGKPYTVFVVVDGGDDNTAEVARRYPGVKVFEFPVNLGHGVALQVTYRYCAANGVKYCLTWTPTVRTTRPNSPIFSRLSPTTLRTSCSQAAFWVKTRPPTPPASWVCALSRSS